MTRRRHRRRYEHRGDARYLTFSCFDRLALFANDRLKDAFTVHLEERHQEDEFLLFAWVIMPEHVHMLLIPPRGGSVTSLLGPLKEPFAKQVLKRWRALKAPVLPRLLDSRDQSHFWQRGGGYDRNIISEHQLLQKIEYIHNNPVRRGLVKQPTDWPWSSARWYAGDRSGPVTIDTFRP